MKALLDTSVLVSAFYHDHLHHEASLNLLLQYEPPDVCCSAHSIAEVYASLTSMPGARRVHPDEALLYLSSLKERLIWISLDAEEYLHAAELAASSGASSGGIYDAVIGQCFLKSKADRLYTWNLRHFQRLTNGIGPKACSPSH